MKNSSKNLSTTSKRAFKFSSKAGFVAMDDTTITTTTTIPSTKCTPTSETCPTGLK